MFNPKILLVLFVCLLFSQTQFVSAQNALADNQTSKKFPVSFTLSKAATTSAGVFRQDGTLLRTLWNNVKYPAGARTETWDGLDDNGKFIFDTSLRYKVVTNNINYNWDGVVGNTSSSFTGGGIHHGYDIVKGMAIIGNNAYASIGYNEAWPSKMKFNLQTPQQKTWIYPSGQGTTQYTSHVASDGNVVYWAEFDPYNKSRYWVHGTKVGDDAPYNFLGLLDVSFTPTHSVRYPSVIDLTDAENEVITGLAVQKSGSYLFVAHGKINEVHVFEKRTGLLVQKLTFNNPRGLSVDKDDNLWMITGPNTVARYSVNLLGGVYSPSLVLSGLTNALATQVSYDGAVVCVVDGGTAQQVKAFNNNNGSPAWTLGQPGGYASNSNVASDKFMFDSRTYIAFQPDGSFWVGDPGNARNQHFSSSRTYIDNIAYLPQNYVISVDENNPSRVFCGFWEFAVDYSKPLAPNNGSWKLVKNWGYDASPAIDPNYTFHSTYTLSNGRTYSVIREGIDIMELVELVEGGGLRKTGLKHHPEYWLSPDGSLTKQWTPGYSGGFSVWVKKPLKGFDSQNNPVWGPEYELGRIAVNADDPAYRGQGMTYKPHEMTSGGIRMNFDGGYDNLPFHLGGVKDGKYIWKTAKSTYYGYAGPFPTNGDFDIGNGVNNFAGSNALAIEKSVFWGYHGEFWKGGQTNVWNHLYENGLMLGQFGTSEGSYKEGYPAMAGNAFSTKVVKVGSDYYLYHNDESYHSGVHRFKISGLNTIQEQTLPVKEYTENSIPVDNSVNLMTGLPFNDVVKDGTNGWNRTFKTETENFKARTSVKTYNKLNGDDIYMAYSEGAGNGNVTRDLGKNRSLSSWKLYGDVTWAASTPNFTDGKGGVFLEVLDNAGKVITSFCWTTNYGNDVSHIKGNNVDITSGEIIYLQTEYTTQLLPLEISVKDGICTFKYGNFDPVSTTALANPVANWKNPETMRIKFVEDNQVHYAKIFDVANMRFSKEQSIVGDPSEVVGGDDLMQGLPYKSFLVDGTKGWNRSSKKENAYFSAQTSVTTDNTDNGDDIFMTFNEGNGNVNVTRDLGTNTGVSGWKLAGKVTWAGGTPNFTNGKGGVFLEVLDDAGKVITTFNWTTNYGNDVTHVKGNDAEITSGEIGYIQSEVTAKLLPLDITVKNGLFTFKYGSFNPVSTKTMADASANWKNPKTLRIKFIEDNQVHYSKTFDVANMHFTKDGPSVEQPADAIVGDDLMQGLPYKNILLDDTKGWNRSAKAESVYFSAKTSIMTDNTDNGDDIFMNFNEGAGGVDVTRDLGKNKGLLSWKLAGKVTWLGSTANFTDGKGGVFLEVLDNAGKVITTFCYTTNYGKDAAHIKGNDVDITSGNIDKIQAEVTTKFLPLEISAINGTVTFKYGDFAAVSTGTMGDPSAKWENPTTMRIRFAEDKFVHYGKTFDVANMRFTKNETPAENVAPKVAITAPTNNSNFIEGSSVNIASTATDEDGTVSVVEFYAGTEKIGQDQTSPYTFTWSNPGVGSYSLTAKAIDDKGLATTSAKVDIVVKEKSNVAPTVVITAPVNNSSFIVSNSVTITSTATDPDGTVSLIEFYAGTEKIGQDQTSPYTFTWGNLKAGTYSLTTKAIDDKGLATTSAKVTIIVKEPLNAGPKTSITSPANNSNFTTANSVVITSNASDDDGTISVVEFYAGNEKIGQDQTSPYTFTWSNLAAGTYSLTTKAIDNKGLATNSAKVDIIVTEEQITCAGTGSINWQYWLNFRDSRINWVPINTTPSGSQMLTSFASPADFGDFYGASIKGYICPPASGQYIFYISTDDNGELWLSSDDNEANKKRIANVEGWTDVNEYDKYPSQKSVAIYLQAGRRYYIEAVHQEGGGGDHLSVGWKMPDGKTEFPIAGSHLIPYKAIKNIAPQVVITAPGNNTNFTAGSSLTITSTGTDTDGQVSVVEFYAGTQKIGQDQTSPYTFTWNDLKAGTYSLTAKAIDDDGLATISDKVNIVVKEPEVCAGAGSIVWQYWSGFRDSRATYVPTNSTPSGSVTLKSFASPADFGDFYGSAARGYICPPVSGDYIFYLSTDDNGELWLSSDDNPKNKQKIAYVQGWTNVNEYEKYPSQKSFPVYLQTGKRYYIEALQQEGGGGDHLSVAWKMPNGTLEQPIAGSRLIPFEQASSPSSGASSRSLDETVDGDTTELTGTVDNLQLKMYNPELVLKTYPNPFASTLNIECAIPESGKYAVQIFTVQGVLLKTIFNGNLNAGVSRFTLNAGNLQSGSYICRLTSVKKVLNKQITLVK
jgi:hypothetical protein